MKEAEELLAWLKAREKPPTGDPHHDRMRKEPTGVGVARSVQRNVRRGRL